MRLPQSKKNYRLRLAALLLLLVVFGGGSYLLYSSSQTTPAPSPSPSVQNAAIETEQDKVEQFADISETPKRIIIDKIGVDALIEPVGLTADGLMAAPDSNELVGWYDKSAKAGEDKYAMLLDGHYGSDTVPAVFRDLVDLEPGDVIEVHGDEGSKLGYEVVESYQRYAEDVDMKKALYPYEKGLQSLTIITCEGEYDPVNISYDKRTVLYAVRVS